MRDVVRELEAFESSEPPTTPPPPGVVRQRGDRLRRRRVALTLAGAVAAVALVVTPLSLALDGDHDAAPPPADPATTSSARGWVQQIPEDFPIWRGLPELNGSAAAVEVQQGLTRDAERGLQTTCEGRPWRPADAAEPVDAVRAMYGTYDYFPPFQRTLALYPDDAAARAAVTDLIGDDSCGSVTSGAGDEARTWTTGQRQGGGTAGGAHEVVRVGNAVLVASTDRTYAASDSDASRSRLTTVTAPLVEAMCVFAASPCTTPPAGPPVPTASPGYLGSIPAAVDVAAGLDGGGDPTKGGPVGAIPFRCGPSGLPEYENDHALDHAEAGARSPGTLQDERTLLLYPDAATAGRELAGLRSEADCTDPDDPSLVVDLRSSDLGDESFLVVSSSDPTGGGTIATWDRVIRVGNALLLTDTSVEPTPGESVEPAVAAQGDALADLLDQMQTFEPARGGETPAAGWVDHAPADFPITAGLPAVGGLGDPLVVGVGGRVTEAPCDGRGRIAGVPGQLTATIRGEQRRVLQVFPDDTAAATAMQEVIGDDTCHARRIELGDEARTWVDHGYLASVRTVVRVGNALLLTADMASDGPTNTAAVAAMCVFAVNPCDHGPTPSSPTAAAGVPDSIPASIDLGPGRTGGADVPFCSTDLNFPALAPDVIDQERAGDVGRGRTLLLYADPTAATAALTSVRTYLDRCIAQPAEAQQVTVTDSSLGDHAVLATIADPGTGAGTTYTWFRAVQVGSGLLLTADVLPADQHADALGPAVVAQGEALAGLLAQMQVLEP